LHLKTRKLSIKKRIIFLTLLITQLAAWAQPVIKQNWQATWIGQNSPSIPNSFLKFRHQFKLDELPKKAIAAIAVDSKYWLWINETLVVFEGQLKRGPTPNDTYYDEVNIEKYLRSGNNTICLLMWYWGKDGFCHKSSGKAGLLFECVLPNQIIRSNSDWKISQHQAFQNSLPPHPNFRLPEHNIRYDTRLDDEQWLKNSFDDHTWSNASILGKANDAPWNRLWKRPVPLWRTSPLTAYANQQIKDQQWIMSLPKNLAVTPYFKIEAPAGLLIDVRTDNYFGGSEPNIRTEYITKNGIQSFESPAFFNGHQVIYRFPKEVKVLELSYRATGFDTDVVGQFESDDSFLNKLREKSITTMLVNLRDGIQDSPDRERAQWWGDVVIVLEELLYSCDKNAHGAIQKAISNLLEWQKPDGTLFSPVPAGNWDKELPAQMLASMAFGNILNTAVTRPCFATPIHS
jgi:alpha-L-rhamnosidase